MSWYNNNLEIIINKYIYEYPDFNSNLSTYVSLKKINFNKNGNLSTRYDTYTLLTHFSQYKSFIY